MAPRARGILWLFMLSIPFCSCATAQSLREMYKMVNPSVGIILTMERVPSLQEPGQLTKHASLGSGVLISGDGKMVTAAHVVQTADNVVVRFLDGEKIIARVIASSPHADLALLQLDKVPDAAVPVPLGDSDKTAVGDEVFIIGAPYGIGHSLTVGHISGRHSPNMVVSDFELAEFFQTDAAINQGNSGGPMFNMDGEVVGIVSNILSLSGGFEGVGFAVTSNTARKLLLDEPTPWTGIEFYALTGDLARAFNLPQPAGMLVERVAVGSLCFKMGLKGGTIVAVLENQAVLLGGDVVLEVQGMEISTDPEAVEKIRKKISETPVGGTISAKVLRAGETVELSTTRDY